MTELSGSVLTVHRIRPGQLYVQREDYTTYPHPLRFLFVLHQCHESGWRAFFDCLIVEPSSATLCVSRYYNAIEWPWELLVDSDTTSSSRRSTELE